MNRLTPTTSNAFISFSSHFSSASVSRLLCGLLVLCVLLFSSSQLLAAEKTFVIYPELSGAYKNIFQNIIKGIVEGGPGEIELYPLADEYRLEEVQQALTNSGSNGIISLGKKGHSIIKQLQTELPTVAGALSLIPNGISGVSLAADPFELFARLKKMQPKSQRVFVVYSERSNSWLIPLAQEAAKQHNLQFFAYPAADLREAMHHYRNLLKESQNGTDAIWLPLDRVTVNDDVVLPLLLQSAWDKDLILMSNKPAHAKRGVLFAMYPDNYGLGTQLAKLLQQQKDQPGQPVVVPLKQLHLAVNLRTASHLGLNFNRNQRDEFTLTFPSR